MDSLRLKIPPPLVALGFALAMWILHRILPDFYLHDFIRFVVVILCLGAAAAFLIPALDSFKRYDTTVSPLNPHGATRLVDTGIYRLSRNPMYVSILLTLLAFGLWLTNAFSIVLCLGFVVYMNRFQIEPEEEALEALFGEEYREYKARVRRWI